MVVNIFAAPTSQITLRLKFRSISHTSLANSTKMAVFSRARRLTGPARLVARRTASSRTPIAMSVPFPRCLHPFLINLNYLGWHLPTILSLPYPRAPCHLPFGGCRRQSQRRWQEPKRKEGQKQVQRRVRCMYLILRGFLMSYLCQSMAWYRRRSQTCILILSVLKY